MTDRVPSWQQDALRRLIESNELDEEDYVELTNLCRHAHELELEEGQALPEIKPLSQDHCGAPGADVQSVKLLKLYGVKGVNALAEGQELHFGADGITVIYGDNGSGKSGYGRVLRALCGARGVKEHKIRGNVYIQQQLPVECNVNLAINGQDVDLGWKYGESPPTEMSSIGI